MNKLLPNSQTAYRKIKKPMRNTIPNRIPNDLTGGLPNDYRVDNGHSSEAAYRDTYRGIDEEVYRKVPRQRLLPSLPRFTETLALLESASARRHASGEKDQEEKDHRKRSREKKKLTRRSPILIPKHISEKHLQVNAECEWLPKCLIPHEDYWDCMKHVEAL